MKGTVKWFNNQKGYGFITGEDGTEYFVHHTGISGEGFKSLNDNQKVEFDLREDDKGRSQACNVTKLS